MEHSEIIQRFLSGGFFADKNEAVKAYGVGPERFDQIIRSIKNGERTPESYDQHQNTGRPPANKTKPEAKDAIVAFYRSPACDDCRNNIADVARRFKAAHPDMARSRKKISEILVEAGIKVPRYKRLPKSARKKDALKIVDKARIEAWLVRIEESLKPVNDEMVELKAAIKALRTNLEAGRPVNEIAACVSTIKSIGSRMRSVVSNMEKDSGSLASVIGNFKQGEVYGTKAN